MSSHADQPAPAQDQAEQTHPEAVRPPSQLPRVVSPLMERSQQAFRRDLPQLLKDHSRQWVAYHGDDRIGFGLSKRQLYQECLRRGLKPGAFAVRSVEPNVPREAEPSLET